MDEPFFTGQTAMPPGVHKGIVVDNRDPWGIGLCRVYIYPLHGDFKGIDLSSSLWAYPGNPFHQPPDKFTKVLVSFDSGGRDSPPIYFGCWTAVQSGRGSLPHENDAGTDTRPEGQWAHDLYPESVIAGKTGDGNVIWLVDKLLNGSALESSINVEDSGGKQITVWSFHDDWKGFCPPKYQRVDAFKDEDGNCTLDNVTIPPFVGKRTGYDDPVTDVAPGAIEFELQNTYRQSLQDDNDYAEDFLQQSDVNITFLDGDMMVQQTGQGSLSGMEDCLYLQSKETVFVPQLFSVPRDWT